MSGVQEDKSYEASTSGAPTNTNNSLLSTHPTREGTRFSLFKEKQKKIPAMQGLKTIILSSYVNLLLVFVPIGIASHFVWSPTVTFIMNFLAIVPLAKLLGFATEDIALRTGEVIIQCEAKIKRANLF